MLAVLRKIHVLITGESKIARNCQIPDIRKKYRALGLADSSGTFVEVGAFDGEAWSNTSFLADQGWTGLYAEPIPAYARRTRRRHMFNDVKVEVSAVAEQLGTEVIKMMGPLTTMSDETFSSYLKKINWAERLATGATEVVIRTDTLGSILSRNKLSAACELMIIYVEGGEELVVEQLLAGTDRPTVLIVEIIDRGPDFVDKPKSVAPHARIRTKLLQDGYDEFYSDNINTIFFREGADRNPTLLPDIKR